MTREIKFRAWSGEKMYFTDHGDLGRTGVDEFEWCPYCFVIPWKNGPPSYRIPEVKDWKVMQYTGLHDKNGKEIYEGDIVEEGRLRGEVIFEDASYFFTDGKGKHFVTYNEEIEVIGNIYENPELLS